MKKLHVQIHSQSFTVVKNNPETTLSSGTLGLRRLQNYPFITITCRPCKEGVKMNLTGHEEIPRDVGEKERERRVNHHPRSRHLVWSVE